MFDIDGVVADVRHRLHHIVGHHAWHRFFEDAADDPLLAEGAALARDLGRQHEIVWLTGRPDWLRDVTVDWMLRHDLPADELHMRPEGDFRPARVYKLGVLRRLAPRGLAAFVDDDLEVVDAAVAAGYPAVVADWVPREDALRDAQERFGRT